MLVFTCQWFVLSSGCWRPHFSGKCFSHILCSVEQIKLRLGPKSPEGIRGSCASIPLARFCSILAYSRAFSCALNGSSKSDLQPAENTGANAPDVPNRVFHSGNSGTSTFGLLLSFE